MSKTLHKCLETFTIHNSVENVGIPWLHKGMHKDNAWKQVLNPYLTITIFITIIWNTNGKENSDRVQVINGLVGTTSGSMYISLDDLIIDRSKCGFIKIDVDGTECDVLDSGVSLLMEASAYLLIETHSREIERECIIRLETLGYVCRIIQNAWWRIFIPELRPINHNRWLWASK